MNRGERQGRGRRKRPNNPTASPDYATVSVRGSEEEVEDLFADAIAAQGVGIICPVAAGVAGTDLPDELFVAVVPDYSPPLAPLFAARGTGSQRWTVKGQTGWTAAMVVGDPSPARVVLKLMLVEPVVINAKILFMAAETAEALAVAAEGGWIGLMTASAWQAMAELAPEGGSLADVLERAVLLDLQPSLTLGPFLAGLSHVRGGAGF